ncbi:hypothetical protein LSTR_LSTR007156 [Laodelphax striatellus]|uniref:Protein CLP1 homolog n=1 Tax=Laodelphax striatellus TaxID=195883 RepID=A0A482WW80_LAOST|nr:hypothetical protein LSTR_LSTR007156 [Laodelphax striatellus]
MFAPQSRNAFSEVVTTLEPNEQLRLLSRDAEHMTLELQSGEAEIFGARLVLNKVYSFSSDYSLSLFTYSGCKIRFQIAKPGQLDNDRPTVRPEFKQGQKNLMMMLHLKIHTVLEQLRERCDVKEERGPIVMIVGPKDVGKSTLATTLTNYAVRMSKKRTPVFVDTDPGQGSLSLPGTIGSALITEEIQPEKNISEQVDPLIYNVGSTRLGGNPIYKLMISKLAASVLNRLESNKRAKSSGLIINTPGWTQSEGFDLIKHTAQAFEVDIILVLYQKKLYDELYRVMPNFVKLVQMPKLEGVRFRSQELRWECRDRVLKDYFYGPNNELKPYVFDVEWKDFKVYKVFYTDDSRPESISLSFPALNTSLRNRILAVTFAQKKDDALESNISGFVCVADVVCQVRDKKVTLLSPFPPPLPDVCYLMTSLFLTPNSIPNNGQS